MKTHRKTATAAIVAMAFAALGIAQAANAASVLQQAQERGYLRAGFANEAPYGFINAQDQLTGSSPEIAKYVIHQLGIEKLDGIVASWGALIPGLKAHRWDLVAAGMFITPARCAEVDFSIPTYKMGSSMIVQAGNPHDIHSYKDIAQNPDLELAVMAGAVEYGYAKKAGIDDSQITQVDSQAAMLAAVKTGRVDAGALTSISIQRMVMRASGGVERAQPFHAPDYTVGWGGFAFRESADKLRKAFNRVLRDFIGSQKHLQMVKPFGYSKVNMPGDMTTEQLCQGADE